MNLNKDQVLACFASINDAQLTPETAEKIKVVALAKAAAYASPMPSSPVTNLNSYWIENCRDTVDVWFSNICEYQPFNVRLAVDLAFQVFRARYNVLHVPRKVDCHALIDAMIRTSECREIEDQFKGYFEEANGDRSFEAGNNCATWLYNAFAGE